MCEISGITDHGVNTGQMFDEFSAMVHSAAHWRVFGS